jgi:type I restriction enzyme M protein
MKKATSDIAARLWTLCNILKDDGVTYHQYVTELTYLLFLKMAAEIGIEDKLPSGYRWGDITGKPALQQLEYYKIVLIHLGLHGPELIKSIFENATSFIKKPNTLAFLVSELNKIEWYSVHREDLGDLYEGLLEKNANEKKSGAGQYFTPRALIDSIVNVMKPSLKDVIQDPAAGTGGFLIAANHYMHSHFDIKNLTKSEKKKYQNATFFGMEHVQDTHRLALMNLMLHGIDGGIEYGDTLGAEGASLCGKGATLILTNPPFGTKKGGGRPTREDLPYVTSNKQLAFLQHVYLALVPGGRAAVVVPDNVLFEGNIAAEIRRDILQNCNLHTILRLPTGIFYAQGVKTSVLFFTKNKRKEDTTQQVWVYDLRANTSQFGRRTQLTREHFFDFEKFFGSDPLGGPAALAQRVDTGVSGRFRCFTRAEIEARRNNLDIVWLSDTESAESGELSDPVLLAQGLMAELIAATSEVEAILEELGDEGAE